MVKKLVLSAILDLGTERKDRACRRTYKKLFLTWREMLTIDQ